MVTFLSERLQHKQRKTLKVLIAADSETNLCVVSTPSLYTQSWCYGRFKSEYLKIVIQDENLLFQFWLTRAQVSSWPRTWCSVFQQLGPVNLPYWYGKHSSQKMEQHQRAAGYGESSSPSKWIILSCGTQHWNRSVGHPSYQRLLYRRQRTPFSGPGGHSSMTHSDLPLQIMSYTLTLELWSRESQTSRYTA